MPLVFQELGGSPREHYSLSGFTAVREFLVPWENRTEFVRAVFGTSSLSLKQRRVIYPGRKDVFATSLRFEPLDADAVNPREMSELGTDLVDYDGSFAKAVVEYAMLDSQERKDAAMPEDGTAITYAMKVVASDIEMAPAGWKWSDTGAALSAATKFTKRVPVTEHHLTWSYVSNPPWTVISSAQGKVNSASFLGCAPGTLLFEGGEANKLYKPGYGLDEGVQAFCWQIKYIFRELSLKGNGSALGWNAIQRTESGSWATVSNTSGRPLYDSTNFQTLFVNATLPFDLP